MAVRPKFLSASILPMILGTRIGYQLTGQLDVLAFLLALFAVIFAHAGTNVINDVYDDIGGTDRINTARIYPYTGGSRIIQDNILTRDVMGQWGLTLLIFSGFCGAILVFYVGYWVLAFGLIGITLGVAYSVPPLQLAARGLGESAVAIGLGVLPIVGATWLQVQQLSWNALWLSIPVSLWVANILIINEVPDTRADSDTGKRTLVVRFGSPITASLYFILNVLAGVSVITMSLFGFITVTAAILPLVSLLAAGYATYTVLQWPKQPQLLKKGIQITLAIHTLNCLWLIIF